jgi:hypothetical protein
MAIGCVVVIRSIKWGWFTVRDAKRVYVGTLCLVAVSLLAGGFDVSQNLLIHCVHDFSLQARNTSSAMLSSCSFTARQSGMCRSSVW